MFTISPQVSVHLGVSTTRVWIESQYIRKLLDKHKLGSYQFSQVPKMVMEGQCFLDPRNNNHVVIFGEIDSRLHKLVLKGVARKDEIWLVTFHRAKEKQRQKMRQTGVVIK